MSKSSLKQSPKYFRTDPVRGLAKGSKVVPDGGKFGAGLVEGVAIITRGEALGHNLWIDETFVAQVAGALSDSGDDGIKSRFTHPDLSGDGLAKGLGRVVSVDSNSGDITRGDLHIWQSSRRSPDGDLGGYILSRAAEDPDSFGISISFEPDVDAEKAFFVKHGGKVVEDPIFGGEIWDPSEFKSPDSKNKMGFPHARLAELRAVDTVDDPAANPAGLFHRDETFKEAEGLLEYALGFSDRKPELVSFDVDPDRVGGFFRRFLNSRGLQIMKVKGLNDVEPKVEETPPIAAPVAASENLPATPAEESDESKKPKAPDAPETSAPQLSDGRKEVKRFIDAFGAQGGQWYAEGKSFDEAQGLHSKAQTEKIEKLEKQLAAAQSCEGKPLSSGGADEKRSGRSGAGLASKIRMPEASRN